MARQVQAQTRKVTSGEYRVARSEIFAFEPLSYLKIERDHAGHGTVERNGRFASEGLAQHLNAAWSGTTVNHIDLRQRQVGELLIFPKDRGRGHKQSDVQAVVASLAIEE